MLLEALLLENTGQDLVRTQRRAPSRLLALRWWEGWGRKDLRDKVILGLGSVSQGACLSGRGGVEHPREALPAWHVQRNRRWGRGRAVAERRGMPAHRAREKAGDVPPD